MILANVIINQNIKTMKNYLILLTAFIMQFSILACSNVFAQEVQNRNVRNFEGIQAGGGVNVYIKQGETESVRVEADKKYISEVVTEVRNGVLHIKDGDGIRWGFWGSSSKVNVYVTFKTLKSISSSGGADIFGQGLLTFKKINLTSSGGSDIKLHITADEIYAKASGGSDIILEGNAYYFEANASGGSDIKAKNLETSVCRAISSGGADIFVTTKDELTASASGGSDIIYYGNPAKVNADKSGGASVIRK
jgi:hypothetical protein